MSAFSPLPSTPPQPVPPPSPTSTLYILQVTKVTIPALKTVFNSDLAGVQKYKIVSPLSPLSLPEIPYPQEKKLLNDKALCGDLFPFANNYHYFTISS